MADIGPLFRGSSLFKSINIKREVDQKDIKTFTIVDPNKLNDQLKEGEKSNVNELLKKYDLRNIDGSEMTAFLHLLRNQKAIGEDSFDAMYEEMTLVFEDKPIGIKLDVIAEFQKRLDIFKGHENEVGDVGINSMKRALAAVKSIDNAKNNGLETIIIDQYV